MCDTDAFFQNSKVHLTFGSKIRSKLKLGHPGRGLLDWSTVDIRPHYATSQENYCLSACPI